MVEVLVKIELGPLRSFENRLIPLLRLWSLTEGSHDRNLFVGQMNEINWSKEEFQRRVEVHSMV